jgi:hypothetical protein
MAAGTIFGIDSHCKKKYMKPTIANTMKLKKMSMLAKPQKSTNM